MSDVFLGLDLGTTNCKALAVGLDGASVVSASLPTPLRRASTDELSYYYDAGDLWDTAVALIRSILVSLREQVKPPARIAGLAVASMGESGVLIDAVGSPLTPVLPWYDTRTVGWLDWFRKRITPEDLYRITGLHFGFKYSALKLLWQQEQTPELFARAKTWLHLADWIAYRLTEKRATSYSLASRSMLFDVQKRLWSEELLRLTNLPLALLPPALPSGQIMGWVSPAAAEATGLTAGMPVVMGGHDHGCAALAVGAVTPGVVLDSAGTAEAIVVALDSPILEGEVVTSGLVCGCHTARDRYYLMGGMLSSGVVNWVTRTLSGDERPETISALMGETLSVPPGANGLWFVPYLNGSGPPEHDPDAWGAWLGLRLQHTRADMAWAAVEGMTYSLRYMLEGITHLGMQLGVLPAELRTVGGGARNARWQQLKADVTGIPVDVPGETDLTALGAALLAGIGVGAFKDELQASTQAYRSVSRYKPDPQRFNYYDRAYHTTYRLLWDGLKTLIP